MGFSLSHCLGWSGDMATLIHAVKLIEDGWVRDEAGTILGTVVGESLAQRIRRPWAGLLGGVFNGDETRSG